MLPMPLVMPAARVVSPPTVQFLMNYRTAANVAQFDTNNFMGTSNSNVKTFLVYIGSTSNSSLSQINLGATMNGAPMNLIWRSEPGYASGAWYWIDMVATGVTRIVVNFTQTQNNIYFALFATTDRKPSTVSVVQQVRQNSATALSLGPSMSIGHPYDQEATTYLTSLSIYKSNTNAITLGMTGDAPLTTTRYAPQTVEQAQYIVFHTPRYEAGPPDSSFIFTHSPSLRAYSYVGQVLAVT